MKKSHWFIILSVAVIGLAIWWFFLYQPEVDLENDGRGDRTAFTLKSLDGNAFMK